MKKKLIVYVILTIVLIPAYETKALTNVSYIKEVKAKSVDVGKIKRKELIEYHCGVKTNAGQSFISPNKELAAMIRYDSKDLTSVKKSYIEIRWKNYMKTMTINGYVSNIYWRPKTAHFIYQIELPNDEGADIGNCTLNYVQLNLTQGIEIKKIKEGSAQPVTWIAWSNDGRYLVYSYTSSIMIKNYDSGIIWGTKKINLDNGKQIIKSNTPSDLGMFYWIDNDKKILFHWKEHYFQDEPAGYAIIDVSQFGLK